MTTSPTLAEPRLVTSPPDGTLTPEALETLQADLDAHPGYRLAQNAVTQVTVEDVALNRSVVTGTDHTFAHVLDDWSVTNQKKSGRCWMFAGLNLLRVGAMRKMNLKEFELSQNHTLFFDKLERANYFLEGIIETADRPLDDRTVALARLLDQIGPTAPDFSPLRQAIEERELSDGEIGELLAEKGVSLEICYESEREDWIQSMIMSGMGSSFMPEFLPMHPNLPTRLIVSPEITRQVELVTVSGRRFSPAVAAFVRMARTGDWSA